MSRKFMITMALTAILVLVFSVGVFAKGPNPANANTQTMGNSQQMQQLHDGTNGDCDLFVDENEDGVCDNALLDGTGLQTGVAAQQAVRAQSSLNVNQAVGGQNLSGDFIDADGNGTCDNFVDADGDGVSDIAPKDGTGSQYNRSTRAKGNNR